MHLKRLYIRNFRSMKELDLEFTDGKNVIVGRNNSGKSNIVAALDAVLSASSPTYKRTQNITEKDFHSWKETGENGEVHTKKEDEIFIWCELQRPPNQDLPIEEMYGSPKLPRYSHGEHYYSLRPERFIPDGLPENYSQLFNSSIDNSQGQIKWIDTKEPENGEIEDEIGDKYSFAYAFRAQHVGVGKIEKDIRFLYREDGEADWCLAFRASFRNEFLQSAIIPPFRDPGGELRPTHYTWYGRLMKYLTEKHADREELDKAFGAVKDAADEVFDGMREDVAQSVLEVAFPNSQLHFQFNPDAGPDLYKNTHIYVDDGVKSRLTEKGSGIQSAAIIGLFNYYTKNVNTISSALLCVEEPELFLHPHARRVISKRLDDFLDSGESPNQVILTTHSVDFIRAAKRALNVILVHKDEKQGTTAQSVPISDFESLLVDNNQNELFFADKVILCEGYDKYVVEAVADDLFEGALDKQNVSVVAVGGKDRLCKLAHLVIALSIECYVLADFDFLLRDKSADRTRHNAKAHDNVLNLGDQFMCQPCLWGNDGNRMKSKLARFRNDLKKEDEEAFYRAKRVEDVSAEESVKLLKKHLPALQKNGLGILSGEIEHCFRDEDILNGGKLDLESVYDMNDRRAQGEKIGDILDTTEIERFLAGVLGDKS